MFALLLVRIQLIQGIQGLGVPVQGVIVIVERPGPGCSLQTMSQAPVKRYNRQLMNLILSGKAEIAKAVNAKTISLDDAPQGYQEFDQGAATKYVIDPHGMVAA